MAPSTVPPSSLDTPCGELAVSRVMSGLSAIRACSVNYGFGEGETRTQVLFNNSLEIGRGEVVILTGPSGSGKTTLLTLIGALRRMQDGSLMVLGRELAGLASAEQVALRREIGFIFQHHNLFSSLTALENVRMAAGIGPATDSKSAVARCTAALAELDMGERMNYLPSRLSGGQRQRVAIARALVNEPALVLADEPTAALDPVSSDAAMRWIRRMADGPKKTTVLIVTHDQRLLDKADRIVNMVNGRIVSNVRPKLLVRIVRVLQQTKELEGLGEMTLTRIAERMTVERRPAGEILVREGQEGTRVCTLGEGEAEAWSEGHPARELTVGEPFGTISSVFLRQTRETVRAKTDVEVFAFTREDLDRVTAEDKGFDDRIQAILMARQ